MIRRVAVALLLLSVVACQRQKEQPAALYERGSDALHRQDFDTAKSIAREGARNFASQAYWREMFGILEAEAETDTGQAAKILEATPPTGQPLPSVRRLIARAATEDAKHANATLLEADARATPELRPEIAWRRSMSLWHLNQPKEAMRCAREAAQESKSPWLLAGAYAYLGSFATHRNPPRYAEAIEHYKRAAGYAHTAGCKKYEMRVMGNLGWCEVEAGNYDDALANLFPALKLAEQQSNLEYQHLALVYIADVYIRRLEFDNGLPYAKRGLQVAQRWKNAKELANSFHQLGQIDLEKERYEQAGAWTDKAITTRPKSDAMGLSTDLLNKARILAATGNPAAALEILRKLAADSNVDRPTQWRAQGVEADIHAKLGDLQEAEEMYEATLATGAKARETVRGSDSSFAFERNLFYWYDNYIDLLLQEGRDRDALRVAERSRARTLREAVGLESDAAIDPVKLAREKKAVILFYWVGARRSLLWTITPKGIDVDELPSDDDIDRDADSYRKELLSRHSLATSTLGPKLYTTLVAPAKIPPGSRVIILPDARLNALNFETLIVPQTKRHYYWIEDATISYASSLHLLARGTAWKGSRDARALLLGDVPAAGREYPQLPRASQELAGVAKYFGRRSVVLSASAATPARYLSANAKQFQFIHFATHATASRAEPLEKSAVILASDKNGYRLSGNDIVHSPLSAELVTISSCNGAGSRSYTGEGPVGLAWAFLGAGAHRVIAAQWDVDDRVAPAMMDDMYGAVARGAEPAEALRAAKLKLVHSDGARNQPAYWAPFVLYGE